MMSTAPTSSAKAAISTPEATAKRRRKIRNRETRAAYLFILPWICGFGVFTVISMSWSAYLSFTNYNLTDNTMTWTGLDNYKAMTTDPKILMSLGNTLTYVVMSVPLETVLALLLAMLLNTVKFGAGLFRVIFYLPKMTPGVATAAVFLLLLNGNQGAINKFLAFFGISGPQWLLDPAWLKPSIVLMSAWSVAGSMVIFLAALKSVPVELYEAAELDGAGPLQRFLTVTLPMISATTFFIVMTLSIAAWQVFDQAYLLFFRDGAGTGPDAALFYNVYLYQQAFQQFNFGLAAAMAWLLFVIIMVITLVQLKLGDKLVYYAGDK